jgi:flagellar protein FlaG
MWQIFAAWVLKFPVAAPNPAVRARPFHGAASPTSKGNAMTKITSTAPQAGVTPLAAPHTPAPAAAQAPAVAAAPVKAELSVPKSNIPKIDPEKMRQQLQQAIEQLNEEMKKSNQELRFSVDSVLDVPVVTVRNSATGDVVRQFPNEVTIRVAHNVDKLKGLLFNNKA